MLRRTWLTGDPDLDGDHRTLYVGPRYDLIRFCTTLAIHPLCGTSDQRSYSTMSSQVSIRQSTSAFSHVSGRF